MALKVLKGFTEGGKYYAPGMAPPEKLDARTVAVLVRTRHLVDPKAKEALSRSRVEGGLTVTQNPDFAPELYKQVGGYPVCPSCHRSPCQQAGCPGGKATPDSQSLAGRALAEQEDWTASARPDTRPSQPGAVVLDQAPEDPLAGRKLAAVQNWKAG